MSTATERRPTAVPDDTRDERLRQFPTLAMAMTKGFLRDRGTLFFSFLFPLMFLLVGGLLFGGLAESRPTVGVVGDGPVVAALTESSTVDVKRFAAVADAAAEVASGDLPAYLVEHDGRLTFRYATDGLGGAGTVRVLVESVVNERNVLATGQAPSLVLDSGETRSRALATIQFLTPGILSWASAMAAVFGVALTLVSWRRNQVLRRLMLAPVRPITVLGSRVVVVLGVTVVQAALFIGLASLPVFGLRLSSQWWLAIPLLLLGACAFFAIGMLIGAVARTEESATGAGNLVIMPMALLSGSFFPPDFLPGWVRVMTNVFPMKHLGDGLTDVMVRGGGVGEALVPGAYLICFTVVVGLLAARVFRWED